MPFQLLLIDHFFPQFSDQRDLVKSNMHRSEFKRLIKEISNLGRDSQGFWKHLPYVMCDQPVNRFQVCF